MDMPERIWAQRSPHEIEADFEGNWHVCDGAFGGTEYRRVVRCAECTCEGGGRDCNWIKSPPDPAVAKLVEALEAIDALEPRRFDKFPEDWGYQIAACPECQRYKDHPIQRGICNDHRQPLYAREAHDKHEQKILGYRMRDIARAALTAYREGRG